MAGWWRSWHERPYSSGIAWRQHAGGTSWGNEDWHGDTRHAWSSAQWAGPSGEWHASSWWGEDGDELQAEAPPSPESAAHEPDQYPWACQEPYDEHCDSGGLDRDASTALEATHDPPIEDGVLGPHGDGPSSAASPQTHQEEKEELEGLHAEAIRRFRLAQPSPDSEDDETNCKEASIVDEDPIDPEIGTYDPKTGGVLCLICDRPQNSKGQFRDHLKGQKHRKKYERHLKLKAQEEAAAAQAALVLPLQ